MRISAKVVQNYTDTNHFSYANQWIIRAGDKVSLYFQFVDLDQTGLRYMTGVGTPNQPVNVTVTFPSNAATLYSYNNATNGGFIPFGTTLNFPDTNPAMIMTVTAQQADPNDPSIWMVTLGPAQVPNSGNVQFTLTEGGTVWKFFVTNMINVQQYNSGSC
jgi:hypothetical protein